MPRVGSIRHSRPKLEAFQSSLKIKTPCLLVKIKSWLKLDNSNNISITIMPKAKGHHNSNSVTLNDS